MRQLLKRLAMWAMLSDPCGLLTTKDRHCLRDSATAVGLYGRPQNNVAAQFRFDTGKNWPAPPGRWVEWVEPFGPDNQPVYMRVAETTAIASAKHVASLRQHTYTDDKAALEDFLTVHWAELREGAPE